MNAEDSVNPLGLRVIKTARDKESINAAAQAGFRPLLKKLEPMKEINSKFAVYQSKSTGEIKVVGDYRSFPRGDYEEVIGFTRYYPHPFPSPYAAYLIPPDIQAGERVFVPDLIEDFIEAKWNQGDVFRLESCEAIWTGTDLTIQYDPDLHRSDFVG